MTRFIVALLFIVGCSPTPANNETDMGSDMSDDEVVWTPINAADLPWLLHVSGTDDDDLIAVGGTPDKGAVYARSTSGDWAALEIPEVPLLNWTQRFGDDLVIVGNGGTVVRREAGTWSTENAGTEEDLWGVWGTSKTDLWAVGGRGRSAGQATILRYNGTDWTPQDVTLDRPNVNAFFKVWGSAADDVYIVGQRGAVLHFDGTDFDEMGVGTSEDLVSIHGTSSDAITIVGGRSNGIFATFNGSAWKLGELAPAPGVNGVFMSNDNTAWIAGARGLLGRIDIGDDDADFVKFDGPTQSDFHALVGLEEFGFVAVGGNFSQSAGPYEGVIAETTELP